MKAANDLTTEEIISFNQRVERAVSHGRLLSIETIKNILESDIYNEVSSDVRAQIEEYKRGSFRASVGRPPKAIFVVDLDLWVAAIRDYKDILPERMKERIKERRMAKAKGEVLEQGKESPAQEVAAIVVEKHKLRISAASFRNEMSKLLKDPIIKARCDDPNNLYNKFKFRAKFTLRAVVYRRVVG